MKLKLQKLDEQKQSTQYIDNRVDKKNPKRQKKGMRKTYPLKTSFPGKQGFQINV